MYCPHCGSQIAEGTRRCPSCERPVPPLRGPAGRGSALTGEEPAGYSAATRMMLPVGRSGLAIAAGYLGLFAILLLPAPFALISGLLAVRDLRRNPHKHGMGRAVFGIVSGAVFTLALLAIFVALVRAGTR